MVSGINRPLNLLVWICVAALILTCDFVVGADGAESDQRKAAEVPIVFPVNERLSYAISWSGIHCGEMEITSYIDNEAAGGPIYRIVVLSRTTKFFDGIYRLRSRLDSYFDPRRMTSVRYDEKSLEKKKRKNESWVVDLEAKEIVRTKNGEESRIPVEVERANDPLAFIYRLRMMDTEIGQETAIGLMTSKGAVETVARVTRHKKIKTKMGKCDAASVVPEPRDEMMFSKSGSMVIWIDRQEPHRPCKIEFDLSFGSLTASLRRAEAAAEGGVSTDWENWGDSKGESQ
jgi:hypothetical protein